jgi:parvulin-like peptidyl-prolyl isomerase
MTIRGWVAAAIATARIAGLLPGPVAAAGQILEQIVVRVNGDPITSTELDERVRVTRALASRVDGAPTAIEETPAILAEAIDELLLLQRAADLGFSATSEDVDRILAAIQAESHVASDLEFAELVRTQGITPEGLRERTRRQFLVERTRRQAVRQISISDEEAQKYYAAHRSELRHGASVTFREVVLSVPPPVRGGERERDAALVRVAAAGDRLAAGAPFERTAEELSESPSKTAGGLVGPIATDPLEETVRAALAALRPGDISLPVRTAAGYSFLKLETTSAAVDPTFAEAYGDIVQLLTAVKERAALEGLLDRLRASAVLQWKRGDLEAAYDRRPRYR